MTLLRLLRLELMLLVYWRFFPLTPALLTFSEPARSTRDSRLTLLAWSTRLVCWMFRVTMRCDLEDLSLQFVAQIMRFLLALASSYSSCLSSATSTSDKFSM